MRTFARIAASVFTAFLFVPFLVHAGLSFGPVVNINAVDAFAHEDPTAPETGLPAATRGAVFVVTRSCCTAQALTIPYAINGTASNGADYQMLSGHVKIPAGRQTTRIVIRPIHDRSSEVTRESVILSLRVQGLYRLGSNRKAKAFIEDYPWRDDGGGFVGPGQSLPD
jgi:hypothetical protein